MKILLGLFFLTSINAQKTCARKKYSGPDNPMNCVCNSTYCDEVPPIGTLAQNQAAIFTSSQSGKRFEKTTANFDTKNKNRSKQNRNKNRSKQPLQKIMIAINESQTFQTIIGFGGAFTDAAGINWKKLSRGSQRNLIEAYYGPNGIGYTIGRTPIASCDFSLSPYSYDDVPGDMNLTYWNLTDFDVNMKIPMIKLANSVSENKLKLFASPWSAPGWMKTTGKMKGGGSLIGKVNGPYYRTYINYIVKYFKAYNKRGINFWGLTMENEPESGSDLGYTFQAMNFTPKMERDFAKGLWGPILRANPVTANLKLMIFDGFRGNILSYTNTVNFCQDNTVYNDPDANKFVDGTACHWYGDSDENLNLLDQTHNNFPSKFILYTESCHIQKPQFGQWQYGDRYAHSVTQVLNNWVTGWVDWNLCLDTEGGPNWVNNFVDAPIIVFNTTDTFEKQPMYYALGHFAKFIVPDSKIVQLSINPPTNIEGVGAITPSGQKVMVLNNRDVGTTYSVSILNNQGAPLNLNLEPRSFTTIIYN